MKQRVVNIIAVLAILAGLVVLLYPMVSNILYEENQQKLVDYYASIAVDVPEEERSTEWDACAAYNETLISGGVLLTDPVRRIAGRSVGAPVRRPAQSRGRRRDGLH